VREHRERRFQRVRQIARLRDRPTDRLIALLEQRVQIVDERLHIARVLALDPPGHALAHRAEPLAQIGERRQSALDHRDAAEQNDRREDHER
jgi:hypothetical protein